MTLASELVKHLTDSGHQCTLIGSDRPVASVSVAALASEDDLVWGKYLTPNLISSASRITLVENYFPPDLESIPEKTVIKTDAVKEAVRTIFDRFFKNEVLQLRGLSNEFLIADGADTRAFISSRATVYKGAFIGAGSVVHPGAVIYPGVQIGRDVEIGANSIIGGAGFGFVEGLDGKRRRFPHVGGVIIGDSVSIGQSCCIDTGSLTPTTIQSDVIIGNMVQIAHNVEISEGCLVGTRSQVAGSCRIGRNVEIWSGSTISNGCRVGEGAVIKVGSIVIKDVQANTVVSGNFAEDHRVRLFDYVKKQGGIK